MLGARTGLRDNFRAKRCFERRLGLIGLTLLLAFSAGAKGGKDPRLAQVTTLFIAGNSEAAAHARKLLIKRAAKGNICLRPLDNADDVDAVLDIAESSTSDE